MKLITPDLNDSQGRIKRLKKSKNMALIKAELDKMSEMRVKFGISQSKAKNGLMLVQGFLLGVWACLFQRIAYHLEDYPQMLNGGFLWFRDLTMPDPYFILPIINSFFMFYNINCQTYSMNEQFKKMKKYAFVMPFMSMTVFFTLPSGFILFYLTSNAFYTTMLMFVRSSTGRKFMNIPERFLEGSKLSKLVSY